MKYKAVISDYVWPNLDIETEILNLNDIEVVDCKNKSDQELKDELVDADALLFCFREISSELLESTTKCKVASRYGIGVDNIDIKKCTELGNSGHKLVVETCNSEQMAKNTLNMYEQLIKE